VDPYGLGDGELAFALERLWPAYPGDGCRSVYADLQVFDIPAIRTEVTAPRVQIKVCPACG